MATSKRSHSGLDVDHGSGAPPCPAVVGPLLGLAYILTVPFAGVAVCAAGIGRRGRDSLVTLWHGLAEPALDTVEKAGPEAFAFRELLQPLLDRTPCEFMVVDREFHITQYCLPSSRHDELLEREAIGQHCFELSHGRNSPCESRECECPIQRVLETNGPATARHYHEGQLESGEPPRAVEITASPVRDRMGNITHVVELIYDAATG